MPNIQKSVMDLALKGLEISLWTHQNVLETHLWTLLCLGEPDYEHRHSSMAFSLCFPNQQCEPNNFISKLFSEISSFSILFFFVFHSQIHSNCGVIFLSILCFWRTMFKNMKNKYCFKICLLCLNYDINSFYIYFVGYTIKFVISCTK